MSTSEMQKIDNVNKFFDIDWIPYLKVRNSNKIQDIRTQEDGFYITVPHNAQLYIHELAHIAQIGKQRLFRHNLGLSFWTNKDTEDSSLYSNEFVYPDTKTKKFFEFDSLKREFQVFAFEEGLAKALPIAHRNLEVQVKKTLNQSLYNKLIPVKEADKLDFMMNHVDELRKSRKYTVDVFKKALNIKMEMIMNHFETKPEKQPEPFELETRDYSDLWLNKVYDQR